ncbi:hypothetical protein ACFQ1S_14560 [Kibdelosporangium lantanae]|uniref:Uncharacterized protein n=1 Tax=Kibdelosporangium lantanae TaxID=1497396 RepID=A0ABW3M7V9_9PSEU
MLDHHQHVHVDSGERDGFEEVTGQQDLGLRAEELGPGAGRTFRCGVDAGVGEDLPHGRCGNLDAKDEGFAVDAAITPARVLLRQAQDQDSHRPDGARPSRAFRSGHLGVVSPEQVAVPAQDGVRAD